MVTRLGHSDVAKVSADLNLGEELTGDPWWWPNFWQPLGRETHSDNRGKTLCWKCDCPWVMAMLGGGDHPRVINS